MNCSENKIVWFDYIEGRLDDESVQRIENHLRECKVCQKGLALAKAMYSEIDRQKEASTAVNLADKVLNTLLAEKEPKVIQLGLSYYIQRIAAVLVISFGVLLGVLLGTHMYDTQKYISSEDQDFWSEELYLNTSNTLADLESEIFNAD